MSQVREFSFDPIAEQYLRLRPQDDDWWAVYNKLAKEINLDSKSKVLDLGCGAGPMSMALLETTDNVFARDPSKEMVEQTRRNTDNKASATQGVASDLPYDDEAFNAVVTWLSVHFWTDLASFEQVHRVVSKGGYFGIVTFTQEHFKNYWLGKYFPSVSVNEMERFRPEAEIVELLTQAGFEKVSTRNLPLTEEVYREDALARVQGKYVSPLHLISDEEYQSGLAKMEKEFPKHLTRQMGWQIIIAKK
jgi:SAM-dependent methyltransferase